MSNSASSLKGTTLYTFGNRNPIPVQGSCETSLHKHSTVSGTRSVQLRILIRASLYTLIRASWAASGSLLKFPLYDFNDYDDDWARF